MPTQSHQLSTPTNITTTHQTQPPLNDHNARNQWTAPTIKTMILTTNHMPKTHNHMVTQMMKLTKLMVPWPCQLPPSIHQKHQLPLDHSRHPHWQWNKTNRRFNFISQRHHNHQLHHQQKWQYGRQNYQAQHIFRDPHWTPWQQQNMLTPCKNLHPYASHWHQPTFHK